MINPYRNINWNSITLVPSCSHEHGRVQGVIDCLIAGGLRHIALSNYYPSAPLYPINEYFTIPEGVIGSPNAEHHKFNIDDDFHCNGLGSFFESGSPQGETPVGLNGASWQYAFKKILSGLQFEDAGGVTINHPHWSRWHGSGHPTNKEICEMLDFDDRVLGIEFYNGSAEHAEKEPVGWDLDTWDAILQTGRRCWGFCVADHEAEFVSDWTGRNVLIVDEFTEHACLKAYREGRFYGKINNTDLKFENISLLDNQVSVATNNAEYIDFVVDGEYNRVTCSSATFAVPSDATYIRVEAHTSEDSIFSNPMIFKVYEKKDSWTGKKMLILS